MSLVGIPFFGFASALVCAVVVGSVSHWSLLLIAKAHAEMRGVEAGEEPDDTEWRLYS
jgi:hypothetical protein